MTRERGRRRKRRRRRMRRGGAEGHGARLGPLEASGPPPPPPPVPWASELRRRMTSGLT